MSYQSDHLSDILLVGILSSSLSNSNGRRQLDSSLIRFILERSNHPRVLASMDSHEIGKGFVDSLDTDPNDCNEALALPLEQLLSKAGLTSFN